MKKNTTVFSITTVKELRNCITKITTIGRRKGTKGNYRSSKNISKNTKEVVNNLFFCVDK